MWAACMHLPMKPFPIKLAWCHSILAMSRPPLIVLVISGRDIAGTPQNVATNTQLQTKGLACRARKHAERPGVCSFGQCEQSSERMAQGEGQITSWVESDS